MPTLVIGDLHFNHTPRGMMEAQLETVKKIVERGIVKHRCDSVIFLGDLMMHRSPRPPVMLSLKRHQMHDQAPFLFHAWMHQPIAP